MRSLVDTNGEQFAYIRAKTLYTLDGEPTGRLMGDYIVDLAGKRIWRVIGDGVYSMDGADAIGYLSEEKEEDH